MNEKEYQILIKSKLPKTFKIKKLFIAFFCGGLIGLFGQILVTIYTSFDQINYHEAVNLMMVTIIFLSSLFTCIGFFDHLVTKAGAGLIVPITGFAHSMASSALEYRKEGLVYGIGANIFKLSGSVILYGVLSAYFFGMIRFLFFS